MGGAMSFAIDEGGDVLGEDAVEGGVCRVGSGGAVAALAWRRRSMRLRATCARHLCRTNRSIFEYLNINRVFEKSRSGRRTSEKALVQCWSELQILNFTLMGTIMSDGKQSV